MREITLTLAEIADLIGGQVAPADADIEIHGIASIKEASPGDLTFLSIPKYLSALRQSEATAALVPPDFQSDVPAALIRVEDPSTAFGKVVDRFAPEPIAYPPGVHPSAAVAGDAKLGTDVSVGPNAVVESGATIGDRTILAAGCCVGAETEIGEDCVIYQNVVIRERCKLGNRIILQPGVIVGGDGFGYTFKDGQHIKVPQTGIVVIEDDVEVGANSTIDRARFGKTWIRHGAKIDNLVMVAHNVTVGPGSILCGQVGVSGSSKLGAFVTLAGQVGVAGHVEIGDQATVGAQSGTAKDVPAKGRYYGSPATDSMTFRRRWARFQRLDLLMQRVDALEAALKAKEANSEKGVIS